MRSGYLKSGQSAPRTEVGSYKLRLHAMTITLRDVREVGASTNLSSTNYRQDQREVPLSPPAVPTSAGGTTEVAGSQLKDERNLHYFYLLHNTLSITTLRLPLDITRYIPLTLSLIWIIFISAISLFTLLLLFIIFFTYHCFFTIRHCHYTLTTPHVTINHH